MRLAVISDIHSNYDAFVQVLEDIDQANVDSIVCLGDNVGYGPEPNEVVNLLFNKNIPSVKGNHELALTDPDYLSWFNPFARISIEMTLDKMPRVTVGKLGALPDFLNLFDCWFVHGFPPESKTTYIFEVSEFELKNAIKMMDSRICFHGHTHKLGIVSFNGDEVKKDTFKETVIIDPDKKYFINVGSVGQPRDADNRAKYVIWDSGRSVVEPRFVKYDFQKVYDKMIAADLPKLHALKLL
ncbi:MAG: metallophosphatase family protein [Desulfobacterales bacterium]|nr:metallophosphatase family protein [Desulfobacterales bacterium]